MNALLINNNPLFGATERSIYVFGFEIYYYALCIITGIITATILSALLMRRRNMSPDFIFTLFIFCIPIALLCARLFYCITDGMPISRWFVLTDANGNFVGLAGLSVIGGVIGGVGTGLVVCLVKKVNFFRAADCVVITILLAQVIGRWGNYFNKEVYGQVVTNPSLQWFPMAVKIGSRWHYALFFWEGCINAIGFALLYMFAWYWTKKPNGVLTLSYFVWYGTVRAIMEPLRDSSYILGDGTGVMWSELFSILMIVGGLLGIGTLLFLNYRKEGSLIGSKTGDPCGITKYLTPYKDDTPYFSKINILGANYPPAPPKEEKAPFKERVSAFFKKVKGLFVKKNEEPEKEEQPKEEKEPKKEDSTEVVPENTKEPEGEESEEKA